MLALAGPAVQHLTGVLRRRGPRVAAIASVVVGAALLAARISGHLGFELALGANLLAGVLGGVCGIAAARRELELAQPLLPSGARAAAAGAGATLLLALVPLAMAGVKRIFLPGCDDLMGLGWYALLPVPSALAAGALGALCGLLARGRRRAGALYAGVAAVSLGWSLWPLWSGPQAFAYNALFGWLPGPLYDEALSMTTPLFAHRAITLGWAIAAGLACAAIHPGGTARRLPRAGAALALGAALVWAGRAPALGLTSTVDSIAARLGASRETAHFVVHFPREKNARDVERLLEDHELRYLQVTAALGAAPAGKLRSFVYRSADEKRALMGAAQTELAKPWRGEIHVVDRGFPHPVLRHEIAHAVAASFASPPFYIAGRGLSVNMGLTEGLAVAVGGPGEELTTHQWARVLVDLGKAPRLQDVMALRGFWAEAPGRAYTYAGSVVSWLLAAHGPEKLRAAYRSGDLTLAYGQSLDALEAEHRAFLAGVAVPAEGRAYAEHRLSRPSIFRRSCAREVAALRREADGLVRGGESGALLAVDLYARCEALDPEDPAHVKSRADALAAAGRLGEARAALLLAARHPKADAAVRAEAGMSAGDLAWKMGESDAATTAWSEVLRLHKDRATDRLARAKLHAADDPESALRALPYLWGENKPGDLVRLRELCDLRPASPLAPYLVGRALVQAGDHADGRRFLVLALERGFATGDFRAEALRLSGSAAYLDGRRDEAGADFRALADDPQASDAERSIARDWLERLAVPEPRGR